LATVDVGVNGNPVADFHVGNVTTDSGNDPGIFMAQHDWWHSVSRPWQTGVKGPVSPTDASVSGVDQYFVGFNLWLGDVLDLHLFGSR
jgi:hypothetical protein